MLYVQLFLKGTIVLTKEEEGTRYSLNSVGVVLLYGSLRGFL